MPQKYHINASYYEVYSLLKLVSSRLSLVSEQDAEERPESGSITHQQKVGMHLLQTCLDGKILYIEKP